MTNTQVTNQPMKANSIPPEHNTPIGLASHQLLNESPNDCPMTHILHTNPFFVVVAASLSLECPMILPDDSLDWSTYRTEVGPEELG